jgi:hypothetical protein
MSQGTDQDVLVDLTQFATVGMYSVGSLAGKPGDTTETLERRRLASG